MEPRAVVTTEIVVRRGRTTIVAVLIGLFGPVLAILGLGGILMAPSERVAGVAIICGLALLWAVAIDTTPSSISPVWRISIDGTLLVATPLLTWSNVGRAQGLFAAAGILATQQVTVSSRVARLGRSLRAVPLVVLVAAELFWIRGAATAAVLALGTAIAAVPVLQRLAAVFESWSFRSVRRRCGRLFDRVHHGVCRLSDSFVTVLTGMSRQERSATSWLPIWVASLLGAALSFPSYWRFSSTPGEVSGSFDYQVHLSIAERTGLLPPSSEVPYPIYHYSVSLLRGVLGTPLASALVLAGAAGLVVVVLSMLLLWTAREGPLFGSRTAATLALTFLLIESPSVLGGVLGVGSPIDWVPTIHMRMSPTDMILVPFALALAFAIVRCGNGEVRSVPGPGLALLTTITFLAKPSVGVVLVVAVPLYVLTLDKEYRPAVRHLLLWFEVPAVVLVVAQGLYVDLGANGLPAGEISIRPLEMIRYLDLDRATPVILAGALVIPLAIWARPRTYLTDQFVRLALLACAVGIVLLVFVNETGDRRADGAFVKPAFAAWVLLCVASWRVIVACFAPDGGLTSCRRLVWKASVLGFLLLSVIAGVTSLLVTSGIVTSVPIY